MFTNVPSQQPDDQLQKRHIVLTSIIKDNKQGTYEMYTYKTNDGKLKSLISVSYNIKLVIETDGM